VNPVLLSELADLLANLGRDLQPVEGGVDATLGLVARRAVELIEGAECASISRGRDGEFETVGATGELAVQVDRLQYELGSGPCVDAAVEDTTFRTGALGADPRWPDFGPRAAAAGVASMLAVRLFLEDDDLIAALNIYSDRLDAFEDDDVTVAMLLASHASLAVTGARLQQSVQNLQRALVTSRDIGAAIGVLMNRHKITQDQGFDLLRLASQHSHRKLADIAAEVIATGTIDLPLPPAVRR
jgi:GAF domain-containing protein